MNKTFNLVFVAAVFLAAACTKVPVNENIGQKPKNYATIGSTSSKEDGKPIEITYTVGHNLSECNGCVYINGELYHVDCQGWGDACVVTIRLWPIGGQPKGDTFNALVDTVWCLTTEDFFNMPNRSLTVLDAPSENETYLNIPEQLVFRDSVTRQFTFTGLFFSNTPAYNNN